MYGLMAWVNYRCMVGLSLMDFKQIVEWVILGKLDGMGGL